MKAGTALICLMALAFAAPVAAAPADHLSEQDATVLARYAMPQAFLALQQRCQGVLGKDAYMFSHGNKVEAKLKKGSEGSWSAARDVLIRMAAKGNPQVGELLTRLPRDSLQPYVEEYVAGQVDSHVPASKCERIDRVLALLDPLPANNLAQLAAMSLVQAQSRDRADEARKAQSPQQSQPAASWQGGP